MHFFVSYNEFPTSGISNHSSWHTLDVGYINITTSFSSKHFWYLRTLHRSQTISNKFLFFLMKRTNVWNLSHPLSLTEITWNRQMNRQMYRHTAERWHDNSNIWTQSDCTDNYYMISHVEINWTYIYKNLWN